MSNLRLKQAKKFVPIGNEYTDPRTGKKFCGYQLGVDGAINALIEHRQRNPKHYPATEYQWFSPTLVRQEFLRHIKVKDPTLIAGGPDEVPNVVKPSGPPSQCACGNSTFNENYCATCGGNRVNGFKCSVCGKFYDL